MDVEMDKQDKKALKRAVATSKLKAGSTIVFDIKKERDKRREASNTDVIKVLNDQINKADRNKDEKEVQRLLRKRATFQSFIKATTVKE